MFWRIFRATDGDRPIGMVPGSIPVAAIVTYARQVEGIRDRRALATVLRMVRAIDEECMAAMAKPDKQSPK